MGSGPENRKIGTATIFLMLLMMLSKSNLPAGRECERQIDQAVYRGLLNRAKR